MPMLLLTSVDVLLQFSLYCFAVVSMSLFNPILQRAPSGGLQHHCDRPAVIAHGYIPPICAMDCFRRTFRPARLLARNTLKRTAGQTGTWYWSLASQRAPASFSHPCADTHTCPPAISHMTLFMLRWCVVLSPLTSGVAYDEVATSGRD